MKRKELKNAESRILRLVIVKSYDPYNLKNAIEAFKHIAKKIKDEDEFEYLVCPGGFLRYAWPFDFNAIIKDQKKANTMLPTLNKAAGEAIYSFWQKLPAGAKNTITEKISYITFGVDSDLDETGNPVQGIQSVALFDTHKSKVIHWTGKSYPTMYEQAKHLVEYDLESHFTNVNKLHICILGCHDLKMFSPRSKAIVGDKRKQKILKFDKLMRIHKPTVILHHPHNTDTYRIWNTEWRTIEKNYPYVNQFVSGIRYYNDGEQKRGDLKTILKKCSKGSVVDINY